MEDRNREDWEKLFGRFVGTEQSEAAAEDIRRGQTLLELYPAPQPDARLVASIKRRIAGRLAHRHRFAHLAYRIAPAAAAVIVIALLGRFRHGPAGSTQISYASLIPTAIWESDDINADDVELAYFAAEIEQIEAQMRALEAGDADSNGANALDEVEVELLRIDTEFWKE
ncbi:MAG: hypothetical protein JW993_08850 [Sedimentisphaerales bacterium]|nr:hypothetical protein [Sedimentisphaerales bacterium]